MSAYTVGCFLWCADCSATEAFLTLLGARPAVRSTTGGWVSLVCGAGEVSLHSTSTAAHGEPRPGDTELYLSTPDLTAAQVDLASRDVAIEVWDEAFGRQARVLHPRAHGLWLDEAGDHYGYETIDVADRGPLTLTVVRYSTDFAGDIALFGAFGYDVQGEANQWWTPLAAAPDSGVIGLHHVGEMTPDSVELSFSTTEPLTDIEARLVAAGHSARIEQLEGLGDVLMAEDPDGRALQVHPVG